MKFVTSPGGGARPGTAISGSIFVDAMAKNEFIARYGH